MNMFKKNGGFTLVELIVVIAILAILAAVAVPAYTGYIAKAEEAAVVQTLGTINTAAQGLAAAEGAKVETIVVTNAPADDKAVITVVVTTDKDTKDGDEVTEYAIEQPEIEALTGELDTMFDASFEGAKMESNKWSVGDPSDPTDPSEGE